MRKDKRKDDIHNYSFFLFFSFLLIWFDLRDWKKEIERLKEENETMIWEMMMREWKKKERQIKTIEKESKSKSLLFIHSFIYLFQIQISDFNCELIDWLIYWDDLRLKWEWEKWEKSKISFLSQNLK